MKIILEGNLIEFYQGKTMQTVRFQEKGGSTLVMKSKNYDFSKVPELTPLVLEATVTGRQYQGNDQNPRGSFVLYVQDAVVKNPK